MLFVDNVRLDSSINVMGMAKNNSQTPDFMFMALRYGPIRPFRRFTRVSETGHQKHNRHVSAAPCPHTTPLPLPTYPHMTYLEFPHHFDGAGRL